MEVSKMEQIQVLVVDDSAFMRKVIQDILESDSNIKVIATARNGVDCLEKLKTITPDVITMDIEMPLKDGISTLAEIMKVKPLPVVMLSSLTQKGAAKTSEALTLGAIDFIAKPAGAISLNLTDLKDEIIAKVLTAAKANIEPGYKAIEKLPFTKKAEINRIKTAAPRASNPNHKKMIFIGTSTGGPRTLQHIIKNIPKNFAAPILIVQHMPAHFTKSLANRLNSISQIKVKEAEHGETIEDGVVYIAPGDYHMKVQQRGLGYFIELSKDDYILGLRPSVDVLLESLVSLQNVQKYITILTGMGKDGAKGIVKIKENDPTTYIISESEQTAIVYGMPAAAAETGYVNKVLPNHEICAELIYLINDSRRN